MFAGVDIINETIPKTAATICISFCNDLHFAILFSLKILDFFQINGQARLHSFDPGDPCVPEIRSGGEAVGGLIAALHA
jgi:hypothetical protein